MRILMLIDSMGIGGAETHVASLASELRRGGSEVCIMSGGGALIEAMSDSGLRHIYAPFGKWNVLGLIVSFLKLNKLLRRERFDIIHAHSRRAAFVGSVAAELKKICFVSTVHARFEVSLLKKHMSRWGYYSIAVSEDLALYLRDEYGVHGDRIEVIPNGVDTCRFIPSQSLHDRNCKRILFVSRLDGDCSAAAYALCGIAERLRERYGDVRIDIAGGGEEYEYMRERTEGVNSKLGYEAVRTLGGVDNIDTLMRGCDLFVGVSRAALEAMSSGIPVVLAGDEGFFGALNEGNISLAAESNFCGRGSAPVTEDALFEHICSMLDMRGDDADKLGRFLREYVCENNSLSLTADKTFGFYRKAIEDTSFKLGDICLCGYYGFGNLGDDALLDQAVRRARGSGASVCALTAHSGRDKYRFGIKCLRRSNPFSVILALKDTKTLVFGGGTLFQDRSSLRSLLYYFTIAQTAKALGCRVEFWGSGIGPVSSRIGRRALMRVLSRCDYVGLRDKRSAAFAKELGCDEGKMFFERDLAFETEACDDRRLFLIKRRLDLSDDSRFAVIALSGGCTEGGYSRIKQRAEELYSRGLTCVFVGMYPKEDREISERMILEVGGKYIDALSAGELTALLSEADYACGARLHLLVLSKLAGVEFEGVGDDPKIVAFCEENG